MDCSKIPGVVSDFVDTLVDFSVGGQFLGPQSKDDHIQSPQTNGDHYQENGGFQPSQNHGPQEGKKEGFFTRIPAAERLVAIGDIHGDLDKARQSLKIAGVIDDEDKWTGGKTTVVQVGDLLDRGGQELKVIYLLEKLKREAQRDGGNVFIMNGNHEIMNMEGDFRFVTSEGMREFENWGKWFKMGQFLKEKCEGLGEQPDVFKNIKKDIPEAVRARSAALRPGGPISSRFLAQHPTTLVIGSTVFAHGGILPPHVDYGLDRINAEVKEWMLGRKGRRGPEFVHGKDAVVWARHYSNGIGALIDCKLLEETLKGIPGANRMVVGHTIQVPGINAVCNDSAIRVDVGMSKGCGGFAPEVLEIRNDKDVRVLTKNSPPRRLGEKSLAHGLRSLLV